MTSTPSPHILVIDDDIAIRDSLTIVLESEGYNVLCAADGAEGLALLEAYQPAVILLDIMMTPMDGLEFLKVLRSLGMEKKYPILVMTAMFGISDELRSLQKDGSISNFILKPLEPFSKFLLLLKDIERLTLPLTLEENRKKALA